MTGYAEYHRRVKHAASLFLLAALASGCVPRASQCNTMKYVPAESSSSPVHFPPASQLAALANGATDAAQIHDDDTDDVVDVDQWKLAGPFPERLDSVFRESANDWEKMLEVAIGDRSRVRLTAPMACVAHEVGRFRLEKGGRPPEDLERYMVARCNAPVSEVINVGLRFDVSPRFGDDEIMEHYRSWLVQQLGSLLPKDPRVDLGIWFGREHGRAAILIAAGRRDIDVEPFAAVPASDGTVRIKGALAREGGVGAAWVTHGSLLASRCEDDPTAPLDRVSLVCKVDPSDPTEWIEVDQGDAGGFTWLPVFEALIRGKPDVAADSWVRPALSVAAPANAVGESPAQRMLADVNAVRAGAGLRPLTLSTGESAVSTSVAPRYFDALLARRDEAANDEIFRGVAAGWNVGAPIHSGRVITAWTRGGRDVERMVAGALQRPSGRVIMLDPDASFLAVGWAELPERRFHGALVSSYLGTKEETASSLASALYARIDAVRASRGFAPTRRMPELQPKLDEAVSRIEGDHRVPRRVLDYLLTDCACMERRSVRGWISEATSLEDLRLPDELERSDAPAIAVAVAHWKPDDSPWQEYVALVVSAN